MATIQAKDIAAIFDKLRDQRDEARVWLSQAIEERNAALVEVDALRERIKQLEFCDCGERLSIGKCHHCDNDE